MTGYVNVGSPSPVSAGSDHTIFIGQSTSITVSGSGTYSWTPPGSLSCDDCQSPTASPLVTTTYIVSLVDSNGCASSDTITVIVLEEYDLFVPNAFSPNGDGHNDILYVRGTGVEWVTLRVYDRVGEKVWETHDLMQGWDGNYHGAPMNTGIFVYYLEAKMYSGETIKKEGDITLVR
jgi:gliding motility-associated-like protein